MSELESKRKLTIDISLAVHFGVQTASPAPEYVGLLMSTVVTTGLLNAQQLNWVAFFR